MTNIWNSAEGAFFDRWEELDPAEKEPIIRRKLNEYIQFAKTETVFYRDRLAEFAPDSEHPLAKIPVLEAKHLRENLPPAGRNLVSITDGDYTVFQSGGTTGMPKTSLFSHEELEKINHGNSRGFYAVGLKPEDRVANLWAVGGLYMTFVHINRMLQQYGCTNFPFSNQTPVDFINTVTRLFNINCFSGIASVVLNCLREIDAKNPNEPLKVDKIFYGGEHIYDADRKELEEKFGTKIIAAPGYGTVDTWYLGYQCSHSEPGVFHAHDDQVYLEIVDPETGNATEDENVGMLLATAYDRRVTPIVRYQVGDRTHWLKSDCPCGRTTPRFKLLGRGDDILRIGYDSIDYAAIQGLVVDIDGLTGAVQMEKQRVAGKDQLIIRVEVDARTQVSTELRDVLEAKILADRPSIAEFVKKGTIQPLKVELLNSGGLPLNPRTGKLIRVIDVI